MILLHSHSMFFWKVSTVPTWWCTTKTSQAACPVTVTPTIHCPVTRPLGRVSVRRGLMDHHVTVWRHNTAVTTRYLTAPFTRPLPSVFVDQGFMENNSGVLVSWWRWRLTMDKNLVQLWKKLLCILNTNAYFTVKFNCPLFWTG